MATADERPPRSQDNNSPGVLYYLWNVIAPHNSSNTTTTTTSTVPNNANNAPATTTTTNTGANASKASNTVVRPNNTTHRSRRVIIKKPSKTLLVNLNETGFDLNTYISCMQLSMWDNISGPRVEQVWSGSESVKEELRLYTARHTLCGVVGQPEQDDKKIETKFHVNSEQGYLITSTIFSATYLGSSSHSKFSLSLLIKKAFLHKYLVVHSVVEDRMNKLVLKLQATLNKNQEGMIDKFTKELGLFCQNLEVLFAVQDLPFPSPYRSNPSPHHTAAQASPPTRIPHQPSPESTAVRGRPLRMTAPSPSSSTSSLPMFPTGAAGGGVGGGMMSPRLQNTLFYSNPADYNELQFIAKAITSHLQTHGSTVITGPDSALVNMYVESLSMFLGPSPKEKKRIGYVDPRREYTADLLLQGIMGNGVKLLNEWVIENMLPTTWIDLENKSIKQTPPFHEYTLMRKQSGELELNQFVGVPDVATTQAYKDINKENLFKPPKPEMLGSILVSRIITEVYNLPAALREPYISQGFRMLIRKAIVMIKYVDAKLNKRPPTEELGEEVRAKVQETLGLTKGDFAVLLGIAEKLKPNFYIDLVGDPNIIQEQFIELFDTF